MTNEEYIKLKTQVQEQYNKAIFLADKQRTEGLKAIETVWNMLRNNTHEPITKTHNINMSLHSQSLEKIYGSLTVKVKDALKNELVPQIFTQKDMMKAINYTNANSMSGCMVRLLKQDVIEKVEQGTGRAPSKYRLKKIQLFNKE